MVAVKWLRLRLARIEDELRDVQRHFAAINARLTCRPDEFTETVRQNMVAAYEFLDAVVADDLDLFSEDGLEALLQLNHLVLLGRGYDRRAFSRHIDVTRQQFFNNFHSYVKPVRRWYRKHSTENPYKVAAQVLKPAPALPGRQSSKGFPDSKRYSPAERLPAIRSHAAKRSRILQSFVGDQVHGQAHSSS